MSLAEYEDFVYAACHVDEDDPAAHWRAVSAELKARRGRARRRPRAADPRARTPTSASASRAEAGSRPTGATTSPTARSSRARSRPRPRARSGTRSRPSTTDGRSRTFACASRAGASSAAEAARGDDYLQSLLDMDAGARVLGEVAFGLNYEIDRFTRNILFDEKIGGTMHLALGSGFPQSGGQNTSGLHWDMICDLRREGEVYADGELIWKNGQLPRRACARGRRERARRALPRMSSTGSTASPTSSSATCTGFAKGDLVCIDTGPAAAPLVRRLWRRVLEAGGHPHLRLDVDGAPELLLREGSDEQVSWMSPLRRAEVERADVRIAIYADVNTRANSGVDPERQARRSERTTRSGASTSRGWAPAICATWSRSIRRRRRRRTPTCPCPSTRTSSSAPASSTATTRAGRVGGARAGVRAARRRLDERKEIRVVGDGTDLTLGVEGRTWVPSDGRENFPDGEVFTGPVETKVEGTISFTYPAGYAGRRVGGVELEFRGGEVVRAEAEEGETFLREMLALDEGARRAGEFCVRPERSP